jgi:carbon monoxide dehydrogenase subunit G
MTRRYRSAVRIEGTKRFRAPRERVFRALTDPHELSELMPGVQRVELKSDDEWIAVVKPPLGRGLNLKLDLHVTDRREPEHARLVAWGKSFGARISIETEFELSEDGDTTDMAWTADVGLAGLLGGRGGKALEPAARHQAERAMERLRHRVEDS